MTGSQAMYKETASCIILGFSNEIKTEDGLKTLDYEQLQSFKTSIYCTDAKKEKALVVFVGGHHYIPEVRAVDVQHLIPVDQLPGETTNSDQPKAKSILYDRDVLQNLLKVMSIDTDEQTPLVIRQAQVFIIKAISYQVDNEFLVNQTHSDFLTYLSEQGFILDFFSFLQRNASKA